jgi:4-diphosphocytidyl-2-C-methyl-D-erythritol kinase
VRTVAPAKINWTLEVLGRREDGYHEIRSVMQTVDLCDEVWADRADEPRFETAAGEPLADNDLIVRATRALEERVGRTLPAWIRVEKRIPVASGLGGGSSDAAAVLRLLNQLHGMGLSIEDLATVGAEVGSDVPFFVYGGTALVEGRGERVAPLPDVLETWMVIICPPTRESSNKTASMYRELRADDLTDGTYTNEFVATIGQGTSPHVADVQVWKKLLNEGYPPERLHPSNAFSSHAYPHPGVEAIVLGAIPSGIAVAGSGPGLFSVLDSEETARTAAGGVQRAIGGMGVSVFVARTLTAAEATVVTD